MVYPIIRERILKNDPLSLYHEFGLFVVLKVALFSRIGAFGFRLLGVQELYSRFILLAPWKVAHISVQ